MKKLPQITAILASLVLLSGPGLSSTPPSSQFSKKQIYTSTAIVNQLTYWHYSKRSFNNRLSSQLFDSFLTNLDPRRHALLTSDIQQLEKHRNKLDNQIKKGDLSFSAQAFSLYRKRMQHQLEKTLKDWPSAIKQLDFTKNDRILIDREDAAWPKNQQEADALWQKNIKAMVLNLEMSDKSDKEVTNILKKRLQRQLKNLVEKDSDDVFQIYMNSLSMLYDPHTNYLSPQTAENFNINMSLKLQGIGAVLQHKDEEVNVVRLIAGGPADKQGELWPNDRIVAVGQGSSGEMVDVFGWELDDVVGLIRGNPKSTVRLEIMRGSGSSTKSHLIKIVRDNVKLEDQSAQKAIINVPGNNSTKSKIGVIKIPTFYMDFDAYRRGDRNYKSTTRDVRKLIDELKQESIDGLVIDLRDNGGGSLREAQELTSLFIEHGPVVQIRQSNNSVTPDGKRLKSKYYTGALVVLIDRLSASASEIFAAAIQDYNRGLVVGDQSYGKGTVQALKELPYGDLKITESKFYRVSGESTQHRGVIPDVSLPPLYDKEEIGESTQDHALKWDKISSAPHSKYLNFKPILPTLKQLHEQRIKMNPDFIFQKSILALRQTDEKYLSLNKSVRKAKNKKRDAELLNIENTRRRSKNEKLLSSIAQLEEEESKELKKDRTKINTKKDFYLKEAAYILADSNALLSERCRSKEAPHCQHPVMRHILNKKSGNLFKQDFNQLTRPNTL
ncbi:MAG: carboxy terminal-processing peptidase [Pseudomonadota bacterium]